MPQTRGVVLGNTLVFAEGVTDASGSKPEGHTAGWAWMPEGLYVVEPLSAGAVRRYLVYWDCIASPHAEDTFPGIGFPYRDLLASEGILTFVPVENPSPQAETAEPSGEAFARLEEAIVSGSRDDQARTGEVYRRAAALPTLQFPFKLASRAAEILNRSGSGQSWSLGYDIGDRPGRVAFLDSAGPLESWVSAQKPDENSGEVLTFSLVNALPVPTPDVPVETILEFRVRRRPELLAFRAALDSLYDKISDSADPRRSLTAALETVERELGAVHAVFSEHWASRRLESLRAYLSLDQSSAAKVAVAAAGAMGAHYVHLSPAIGAFAGLAVNACLTFEKRRHISPLDNLSGTSRDFAYLYYVEKMPK